MVVCAWCKRLLGTKPGPDVVTHGCCDSCLEAQLLADGFSADQVASLRAQFSAQEVGNA